MTIFTCGPWYRTRAKSGVAVGITWQTATQAVKAPRVYLHNYASALIPSAINQQQLCQSASIQCNIPSLKNPHPANLLSLRPCTRRRAQLRNARHGPNGSIAVSLAKLTNLNRSLVNSRETRVAQYQLFRFRLIVAAAAMMTFMMPLSSLVHGVSTHMACTLLHRKSLLNFVQEINGITSVLSRNRHLETPAVKSRADGCATFRWSGQ